MENYFIKPSIVFTKTCQTKTNPVCYHLYVESKKKKKIKQTSEQKKKPTHKYREQTSSYQWGEGQTRSRGLRGTNYYV